MTTPGVVSIVGMGMQPASISDSEIDAIGMILDRGFNPEACCFLREGQRIRVNRGSLEGLEGILLRTKGESRIVVGVTMLQRSVSVEIDRECVSTI